MATCDPECVGVVSRPTANVGGADAVAGAPRDKRNGAKLENAKRSGKVMKHCSMAAFAAMSAVLAVLAVPANAHHSFNTFFDMSRTIAIEGVVTSFRLVSPHSEMLVDVPDASGKAVTWRITARTGAANARREGWKAEDFVGKKVKVDGNPKRREGGTAMTGGGL